MWMASDVRTRLEAEQADHECRMQHFRECSLGFIPGSLVFWETVVRRSHFAESEMLCMSAVGASSKLSDIAALPRFDHHNYTCINRSTEAL